MRYLVKTYLGSKTNAINYHSLDILWYEYKNALSDFGFMSYDGNNNIIHNAIWGYNTEGETAGTSEANMLIQQKTNLFGEGYARSLWHSDKYHDSEYDNSWKNTNYFFAMTHETTNNINSIHPYHDIDFKDIIKNNSSYLSPIIYWMLNQRESTNVHSHYTEAVLTKAALANFGWISTFFIYCSTEPRYTKEDFDNIYNSLGTFTIYTQESAGGNRTGDIEETELDRLCSIKFRFGSFERSFRNYSITYNEETDGYLNWDKGMALWNWHTHEQYNNAIMTFLPTNSNLSLARSSDIAKDSTSENLINNSLKISCLGATSGCSAVLGANGILKNNIDIVHSYLPKATDPKFIVRSFTLLNIYNADQRNGVVPNEIWDSLSNTVTSFTTDDIIINAGLYLSDSPNTTGGRNGGKTGAKKGKYDIVII